MKWMDRLQWWDEIETIERRASRKRLKIVMGSKIKAQNMLMSCVVNWMAKLGLTALRYLTVVMPLVYSTLVSLQVAMFRCTFHSFYQKTANQPLAMIPPKVVLRESR